MNRPTTAESFAANARQLLAQRDDLVKTVERLARALWETAERCEDCVGCLCAGCKVNYDLLRSLGFGEAMEEWSGR